MLQTRINNSSGCISSCSRAVHGTLQAGRNAACQASTLVVVESPTKAKKIAGFLGSGYVVTASMGHVRQLPSKPGMIHPDDSFKMEWQIATGKKDIVADIAKMASKADKVLLAPDPDREGEAIAWHLSQLLQKAPSVPKTTPIQRITFSEITERAVMRAVKQPRAIDTDLVRAYSARICTDYLLGYSLSPLLWRKLRGTKSAGRVQSVALRLVCDREAEREAHASITFYSVTAFLDGQPCSGWVTAAVSSEGSSKFDHDPAAGKDSLVERLKAAGTATVQSIQHGTRTQKPPLPYTTAKVQQDAARYLGFSVKQTMSTSQKLFERGLITYHRTDGVAIAEERRDAIRDTIAASFPDFVPQVPRIYKSKVKNAQEAHDAITVTDTAVSPEEVEGTATERKLYDLVWQSTVACQMTDAHFENVRVTLSAAGATLQVSARKMVSAGYLAVWTPQETRARYPLLLAADSNSLDEQAEDETEEPMDEDNNDQAADPSTSPAAEKQVPAEALYGVLAAWKKDSEVNIEDVLSQERHTEPPRRFSEAMLVKEMESLGIGRPSTYGRIMDILVSRQYVTKEKSKLVPTSMGRVLSAFLGKFFSTWVDFQFTAGMETHLDNISAGQKDDKSFLKDFWSQLSQSLSDADAVSSQQVFEDVASSLEDTLFPLREDGLDRRACPNCKDGRLYLNGSPRGAFVACSNYRQKGTKQCTFIRNFSGEVQTGQEWEVGMHPVHKSLMYIKEGRYGRFVSVQVDGKDITSSLPSDTDPSSLSCEQAVELLKGPTVLGKHEETELDISVHTGRFGPFYKHGSVTCSVGKLEEGDEPSLEHAIARLDKKAERLGTTQVKAAQQEPKKSPKKKSMGKSGKKSMGKTGKKSMGNTGKEGGTHVHHLWISDWRKNSGGSLKEGRAAWKELGSIGKAKAKETYSAQLA